MKFLLIADKKTSRLLIESLRREGNIAFTEKEADVVWFETVAEVAKAIETHRVLLQDFHFVFARDDTMGYGEQNTLRKICGNTKILRVRPMSSDEGDNDSEADDLMLFPFSPSRLKTKLHKLAPATLRHHLHLK